MCVGGPVNGTVLISLQWCFYSCEWHYKWVVLPTLFDKCPFNLSISLSLSLSHTHIHTHAHTHLPSSHPLSTLSSLTELWFPESVSSCGRVQSQDNSRSHTQKTHAREGQILLPNSKQDWSWARHEVKRIIRYSIGSFSSIYDY